MAKRKTPTTTDSIDIKDKLDGPIADVIAALQELAQDHPKGWVEVTTDYEYGESYAAARLNFERDKTPLELECEQWRDKADALRWMRDEARAFERNNAPYPRADEMAKLKEELGFFALAPMHGTLRIYDDEVVVFDMMRGARRRDGSYVLRVVSWLGQSEEYTKTLDELDEAYLA